MSQENKTRKSVPWVIFVWAIGIIFLAMAVLTRAQASTSIKLDNHIERSQEIRTDISAIKTDIQWIKNTLENKN